ncbi:chromosome segregation protein SMC [Eubacterium sp.]|uniref:chromosome segregation protein SMC n=1 Tax=Eubacterium sp. TaxID=142586 RepID=UPI002FC746D3
MYLKKLKMKGFKSFADNVEMEFSQGISAIVGPNGSGKSNITDAIRWVLGEQSTKTLRGKKMEDVIFAGTEKKAPLAYAEVVLTLDNRDGAVADAGDEISVTRRLFRSGDSEYRLNQKNCKLKDIHGIFMDTGLGKNGYSLISQGGIENIINSNPGELRGIVEEAVGIVNYKTRKQEAEKKLERTQDNMDRVQDILDELANRRGPLERQAKKAREYLAIQEELKIVDLFRFQKRMEEIQNQLGTSQKQVTALDTEILSIQNKINQRDKDYQEVKARIHQIATEIGALDQRIEGINAALTSASGDILVGEERCRHLMENANRLQGQQKSQQQESERLSAEAQELFVERDQAIIEIKGIQQTLEGLIHKKSEAQQRVESIRLKMEQQSQREEALSQKREKLNLELNTLKQDARGMEAQLALRQEQRKEQMAERSAKVTEDQALGQEVADIDGRLTQTRQDVSHMATKETELTKVVAGLKNQIAVINNNLKVNTSKSDYLKKIQQNYSDYFPSIQLIMKAEDLTQDIKQQIYGPVGELISVPGQYARAIDVALGGKAQNVVVETVNTASRCIDVLKRRRAGRATFLPMDNLRYRQMEPRDRSLMESMPGVVGIASDLVDYNPRFTQVVESLLARIIVTEDFKAARHIRKSMAGYTIVTLEGEIFYPGGAIVGGAAKGGKQSPLFKKIEIEKLAQEYEQMEGERTRIEGLCDQKEEALQSLRLTMDEITGKMTVLEQAHWQKTQARTACRNRIRELESQMVALDTSLGQDQLALDEKARIEREILGDLEAMEIAVVAMEHPDDAETVKTEIQRLSEQIAENEVALARRQEQKRSVNKRIEMLETHQREVASRLISITRDLEQNILDTTSQETFLEGRRRDLGVLDAQKQEAEEQKHCLTAQEKAYNAEVEGLDHSIRDLNHDLILQKEARNTLELAQSKVAAERDHLEETIYSRYELNYIMAMDLLEGLDLETVDGSTENQRALRSRLSALGQVNVGAIEEYTEVNDRYLFLKNQFDDLIEAKSELEHIIEDLYTSMEKQFALRFSELQGIFSRVFSVLFEGGRAQITYTDPGHVLESGIELVAQPPGKNLRHISLLSGGEKSMTAIALLFSFLELSPSPFCVIDEIDAALDDHNIFRFTSYMEQVARENQFVIITHRKSTLEACDAIYGVSMSKSGISKLVSVRLSDYAEAVG